MGCNVRPRFPRPASELLLFQMGTIYRLGTGTLTAAALSGSAPASGAAKAPPPQDWHVLDLQV